MKRKNLLLLAGLILAFANGCKKDDDNKTAGGGGNNNSSSASMTCEVDSVPWSAATPSAGIINNVSNLTGIGADSSTITITIQETVALNQSYDLGMNSGNAGVYNVPGASSAWVSHASPNTYGQLTITSMDTLNKKIGGTFSFKAWRATDNTYRTITNGLFSNVTYVTSVSGGGSNTFTIKIDNVTFTPALINGSLASGNIMITASDNQGSKSVGLTVPSTITAGTYPLELFTTYSAQYNPNSSTYTGATSGSLTITSHNTSTKLIVGTCNFVSEPFPAGGPPTYNLTNGAFSITYQ